MDESASAKALQRGATLNGKYTIIKFLGAGGFGITYLASCLDGSQRQLVTVKEYFLASRCGRDGETVTFPEDARTDFEDGLSTFLSQAERLKQLRLHHPNIVGIDEVFKTNNTAYYIMEYVPGRNMRFLVEKKRDGYPYLEREAISMMEPILRAVDMLHRNRIVHLDIKPDNIMVSAAVGPDEYRPVLIDFDLSKLYDEHGRLTTLTKFVACTAGYAPTEQYHTSAMSRFSPKADVYALAATVFFLLNGKNPPAANDVTRDKIMELLPESVSPGVKEAIANAMQPNQANRTPSVRKFAQDLGIDTSRWAVANAVMPHAMPAATEMKSEKKIGPKAWIVALVAVAGFLAGAAIYLFTTRPEHTPEGLALNVLGVKLEMAPVQGSSVDGVAEIGDYYMSTTEVTRRLWDAVMGQGPKGMERLPDDDDLPVTNFTRRELNQFLTKLGEITGKDIRVPKPLEWNYASIGGVMQEGLRYSGSQNASEAGWTLGNANSALHPVGLLKPNALGIYDMTGNASELVLEPMESAGGNSSNKLQGVLKVVGDNAAQEPVPLMQLVRQEFESHTGDPYVGLRLVLDR